MRRTISNLFKSYIATIFSIVVYTLTSVMLYKGKINLWPDAFLGYAIGSILLFAPKMFTNFFDKYLKGPGSTKSEK